MEIKLQSGREVDIKRPSVKDAIRCSDVQRKKYVYDQNDDGETYLVGLEIINERLALFNWASAGVGMTIDELYDEYTFSEVEEIGDKVRELSELNPTKERS